MKAHFCPLIITLIFVLTTGGCDFDLTLNQVINPSQNDVTVSLGETIEITIPKGAVPDGTVLTIEQISQGDLPEDPVAQLNEIFEVKMSSGTTFTQPLLVTMKYDASKVPEGKIPECIGNSYFDERTQKWYRYQNVTVDSVNHTIQFETTHLTKLSSWTLHGYSDWISTPYFHIYWKSSGKGTVVSTAVQADRMVWPNRASFEAIDYANESLASYNIKKSWDDCAEDDLFYAAGGFLTYLSALKEGPKADIAELIKRCGDNFSTSSIRSIVDSYCKEKMNNYGIGFFYNKYINDAFTHAIPIHLYENNKAIPGDMKINASALSFEKSFTLPYLAGRLYRIMVTESDIKYLTQLEGISIPNDVTVTVYVDNVYRETLSQGQTLSYQMAKSLTDGIQLVDLVIVNRSLNNPANVQFKVSAEENKFSMKDMKGISLVIPCGTPHTVEAYSTKYPNEARTYADDRYTYDIPLINSKSITWSGNNFTIAYTGTMSIKGLKYLCDGDDYKSVTLNVTGNGSVDQNNKLVSLRLVAEGTCKYVYRDLYQKLDVSVSNVLPKDNMEPVYEITKSDGVSKITVNLFEEKFYNQYDPNYNFYGIKSTDWGSSKNAVVCTVRFQKN